MSQPQQPLVQTAQQQQPQQQSMAQNKAFSPHAQQPQQQHTPSPAMAQQFRQQQQQQQQQQAQAQAQAQTQTQTQAPRPSPDPRSPTFPAGNFSSSGHSTPGVRTPTSGLASPSVSQYPTQQQQTQAQQVSQNGNGTSYATSFNQPQISQQQQNGRLTPGNTVQQRFVPPQQHHPSSHTTSGHLPVHIPNTASNQAPLPYYLPQPNVAPNVAQHNYANATFSPTAPTAQTQQIPHTPGVMGPPPHQNVSKAAPPVKSYQYEMDDSLAGTGINLDEEEQYMNDYETRVGFGAHVPGGRGSFFGAGPASQPAEPSQSKSQEEMVAEAADRAWNEAAHRYGTSRAQDFLQQGFVHPAMLHARMSRIAAANGLELNRDPKPPNANMPLGRFSNPNTWAKPSVTVTTKTSPDSTITTTSQSFLPKDAFLIDQIALLSLATRTRLGELLSDASLVSSNRQQTAHGVIPREWVDAAEPQILGSAVSPSTTSRKRPAEDMNNGLPTPVSEASPRNYFADAIVSLGKISRDAEEARLRKRQKRAEQAIEREKNPDAASRAGSVAPGTPGPTAADQSDPKPLSKKESKKAARLADTSSVSVNSTVSQFMGGKKKKYSWMTGGGSGGGNGGTGGGGRSGASTPARGPGGGLPTAGGSSKAAKGPLTQDASQQIGNLREDSVKGKHIQMRDWIEVLENNCYLTDQVALQHAYVKLQNSDWGDKAKVVLPPASSPPPVPTPALAASSAPSPVHPVPAATSALNSPTVASPIVSAQVASMSV